RRHIPYYFYLGSSAPFQSCLMVCLIRHAAFTAHPTNVRLNHSHPVHVLRLRGARVPGSQPVRQCRATAPNQPAQQGAATPEEEFVGIPPEEDVEVPGTYQDALNPHTKLGKAVRAAVDELNHLNALEMETLQQCDQLLKKLGLKSSIMQAVQPAQEQELDPLEEDEQQLEPAEGEQ
ncbi:hypothetical protein Agub_g4427, partial [Astrephomene gubernaculifera]